MRIINISLVGNIGIEQTEIDSAKNKVQDSFPDIIFNWVNINPEMIFFASGGSENNAKKLLQNGKYCMLLADEKNNSYAAATEVKAYANKQNIHTRLIHINDHISRQNIYEYCKLKNVIDNLKTGTIGLIGNSSPWLIASELQKEKLENTFGIKVEQIDRKTLPDFKEVLVNKEFNTVFSNKDTAKLNDSSRIYEVLKTLIRNKHFDAVSAECFPIVREHKVTACLALAKLNAEGFPAACEGDIPSTVGLMLTKELTGEIPWMANIASVTQEKSLFAHCTVNINLIKNMQLMSHYETNEGLSIRGDFIDDDITIFRLNESFSKIFISEAKIIARPKYDSACRTQIEVDLPKDSTNKLQNNPLGNHHIIIPGKWKFHLQSISEIIGIEII